MSSNILGNLLTTFVLGKMNNFIYFIILSVLGCTYSLWKEVLSSLLFLFLPSVKNEQQVKMKEEIEKIINIVKNSKNTNLIIYFILPGIVISCYAGFLYKLINNNLLQEKNETI